jgi:hypothetical protein
VLGSHWARRPTWLNFAWFALSLFCICGTRAEGKVMMIFGIALVPVALWPRWKGILASLVCLLVAYQVASLGGGGSHAYSLLYATLFELTPTDIQSVPDIAPYLLPLRDETIRAGADAPTDLVALAKEINDQVERFLREKRGVGKLIRDPIAETERQLCVEILKRRPLDVILTPLVKFQMACDGWASGADFGRHALLEKQPDAIRRLHDEVDVLGIGMTGTMLDQTGLQQFLLAHDDPARMTWFTEYEKAWSAASIALRLPDRPAAQPRWAHDFISMIPEPEKVIPGVPVYFLLAWAGMVAAMLIPGPLRLAQSAWILSMLFTWYVATMVGVTNARFRFAYDPVCYIYAVAAVAWTVWGICRLARKPEKAQCAAS